jgi:hypothetical protein
MTGRVGTRTAGTGHVRLVTVEDAVVEARALLDDYEERYGVPSDRLRDAFRDANGRFRETGEYLQWVAVLERWQRLSRRLAS